MPKKIKPKYVIDPVQEVMAFAFTDAQIALLIETLAPVKEGYREIMAQLERCARDYLSCRDQNQEKPTRAEQNAALAEIAQLARDLEMGLRGLDMDTQWELMMMLPKLRRNHVSDEIPELADRLGDVAHAAEQALLAGKEKSGPRIPTHIQRAVVKLANSTRNSPANSSLTIQNSR
jgi:hypothetical protein